MTSSLALVVLTEDSGATGWAPVVTLVRAICDHLVADVRWHHIDVLPRSDAGVDVLRAVGANRWKGGDALGHNLRVQLVRYIANQLMVREGEARFVFFHVDADRSWSSGGAAGSENVSKFRAMVEHGVRVQLLATLTARGRAAELDSLMARLHLIAPYWSIEAWLYQSDRVAIELCRARSCKGAHVAQYEAWATDRTALDDLERPKDQRELHCLNDADKAALADGFPAHAVWLAARSFRRAVEDAGEDGALLHALTRT